MLRCYSHASERVRHVDFETKIFLREYLIQGLTISAKGLGSASTQTYLGMSRVRVFRFKPPFVPRAVRVYRNSLMIRTLLVTTVFMGATLTSSNSATVVLLKTRHMFLRTSPASFPNVYGRRSCVVIWFPYSSAVLKPACDCLVSVETPRCTTLISSATCGNLFTSPKCRLTSRTFNGGDTRVPPILLAMSPILPPFSLAS